MINNLKLITKKLNQFTILEKILFVLFILLIICLIYNFFNKRIEGFEEQHTFVLNQNNDIFDDFYADNYDVLVYNKFRNMYEIGRIVDTTNPTSKSIILDVGTGTGHHVNQLSQVTKKIIGIDISPSMIKKAQNNYPSLQFMNDNILDNTLFQSHYFTHILCLSYTLYYIENKKQFFENCFNWLMPGGYLILRLINKDTIKPLNLIKTIKKNVLPDFVDPNILLQDNINIKDYIYQPNYYTVNDTLSILEETIKYTNGNIRKNEHKFYILDKETIIKMAKYLGFIILQMYDMKECNYENNYLYILQKPN